MTKNQAYFDQVRHYQKDHPSLTWKECCMDVSLIIQSGKQKAKTDKKELKAKRTQFLTGGESLVACPACGYSIPEPGNAWVCSACGHQN
jgi:rubrerythrin